MSLAHCERRGKPCLDWPEPTLVSHTWYHARLIQPGGAHDQRRSDLLPPIRLSGVLHVLAVASGKGGVGKTTVAVNLALALGQEGLRVGLFDADLYGPNVPLMLGIQRQPTTTRALNIPVARTDRVPYIPPFARFGLKVMSLGLVMGETDTVVADARFAGRMLRQTLQDVVWGELDILLLDFPPGTGEPQQTLLKTMQIDGVLLVTTPQDLSLMDTSRSLGLFQQAQVPILGVIENMSSLTCPHCGEPIDVFARSGRAWTIGNQVLSQLGSIPLATTISRGIDAGHPLMQAVPDAPEATAFRQIATEVSKKLGLRA
jgi:ATP-binding protein involved in chromosome partitioning